MSDCHICGRAIVPPSQTVRSPSCECHLDLAWLSSENAALKSKLKDARSGSQGVEVTDRMVERAMAAREKFVWTKGLDSHEAMRAALLAAMGGREDGEA